MRLSRRFYPASGPHARRPSPDTTGPDVATKKTARFESRSARIHYLSTRPPVPPPTCPPVHPSTRPPVHPSTRPPVHPSTRPPVYAFRSMHPWKFGFVFSLSVTGKFTSVPYDAPLKNGPTGNTKSCVLPY